jgi:hypothetical protein
MERKFEYLEVPESPENHSKTGFISGYSFDPQVQMDEQIEWFLSYEHQNIPDSLEMPKKRGRKKLRPLNPTKTEIMDKFWLRGFREFMKMNQSDLKPNLPDSEFWTFFLSRSGNPGKKRKYLSYSKEYKKFLWGNKSFCQVFIAWMMLYGSIKIPRKNFKGNWDLYFNYLCTDLVQPCKENVSITDVKLAMGLLSLVYQKYVAYVNEQIRQYSFLNGIE